MAKKKEKSTESKKPNDKTETVSKGNVAEKPVTRGTGNTTSNTTLPGTKTTKLEDNKNKKIAGGIVAVAIGAMALIGFGMQSSTSVTTDQATAPAVVAEMQAARPVVEAVAPSMIPEPLAPQKAQLAEPVKPMKELAKPKKESGKKAGKLVQKTKTKDVKKIASKQKPAKNDKKSKKTLAAKSND